jgi:4-hydroxy-tetrahydrodipicolinate synthase
MNGVHAAIITPFDADLEVDHDALAGQVRRLIDDGIHGIVANGTVGEGGMLTSAERREAIETAVAAAAGRVPVCADISAPTAEQAAAYARDAAAAGGESLMLLPPLLYRADIHELREFFATVARVTELPIMVYNNPEASGSDLSPTTLAALAATVPAIAAVKECSGDARRIAELVDRCPELDIMVGGDDWALEGLCAGAAGWISGVAVVLPAHTARLFALCRGGELEAARDLYAALLPLAHLDMTPKLVQYFKAALDELGLGGGPCRPPRLPLTEPELEAAQAAVRRATAVTLELTSSR